LQLLICDAESPNERERDWKLLEQENANWKERGWWWKTKKEMVAALLLPLRALKLLVPDASVLAAFSSQPSHSKFGLASSANEYQFCTRPV